MNELRAAILALFDTPSSTFLSAEEIIKQLGKTYPQEEISNELVELEKSYLLMPTRRGKYVSPASLGYLSGKFWSSGRGFGFVTPDDGQADFFIPPRSTGGAWHGDRVLIKMGKKSSGDDRKSAIVEKIISRGNKTITGKLVRNRRQSYLQPDSKRLPPSIEVPPSKMHGAKGGDKVAISMFTYGTRNKWDAQGSVKAVFGRDGTREAATAAILYGHGIHPEFPASVLTAARDLSKQISPSALHGRLDLRDKIIFTIDGADAKDLDDAVSLERTTDGNYILGVHIADVSHYVQHGSPLDLEALERGTSVYYADRVIPMLPVELSNGICSLNPHADRFAMTVLMTMRPNGKLIDSSFHNSVINTVQRMTYADCNTLLADENAALADRYADILPTLRDMANLASALGKKRTQRGALTLKTTESKIICDEMGAPSDIVARTRGVSEQLIEEFMLVANETVAEHMSRLVKPTVYRIHEKPSTEKVEIFSQIAASFGFALRDTSSFSMQAVLNAAEGKPEEALINNLLLHSMMKAKYSVSNLGHFGLAAEFYCHFTSPIRRYPDLVVHRLLKLELNGKLEGRAKQQAAQFASRAAELSSEREVAAETAERDIEKLYKAEYMQAHIGELFDGVISGLQRFGIFVALPNSVEGMIPIETIEGDSFIYDETKLTLTGSNTRRQFKFGMALRVQCIAADSASGQIDFKLVEVPSNSSSQIHVTPATGG